MNAAVGRMALPGFMLSNEKVEDRIKKKNRVYSFVTTDENYKKRFCTGLLIYEKTRILSERRTE